MKAAVLPLLLAVAISLPTKPPNKKAPPPPPATLEILLTNLSAPAN